MLVGLYNFVQNNRSQDDAMAAGVRSAIDDALAAFDLEVAGWREVPGRDGVFDRRGIEGRE